MRLFGVLLSLFFLVSVQGIYIKVGSKDTCFVLKLQPDERCKITYEVSGKNEDNFIAKIKDEAGGILQQKNYERSSVFQIESVKDILRNFQLCFQTPDGNIKVVSFEVIKEHISNTDGAFLSDDHIIQTTQEFSQAQALLTNVYINFHHASIREQTHKEIMSSTEQKISYCSVIKMVVVLLVFVIQLYFVKDAFKDKPAGFSMI